MKCEPERFPENLPWKTRECDGTSSLLQPVFGQQKTATSSSISGLSDQQKPLYSSSHTTLVGTSLDAIKSPYNHQTSAMQSDGALGCLGIFRVLFWGHGSEMKRSEPSSFSSTTLRSSTADESEYTRQVMVHSTKYTSSGHHQTEPAQCTFDTGNSQGNIVAKDFLVNVLGFAEADIKPLTERESLPGIGITDHKLMLEGAVELTWYHPRGAKVFRNMRFLVSPHNHYDLIVGAVSIAQESILNLPNLMAGPGKVSDSHGLTEYSSKDLNELTEDEALCKKAEIDAASEYDKCKDAKLKAKLKVDLAKAEKHSRTAQLVIKVHHDHYRTGLGAKATEDQKRIRAKELEGVIEEYRRYFEALLHNMSEGRKLAATRSKTGSGDQGARDSGLGSKGGKESRKDR